MYELRQVLVLAELFSFINRNVSQADTIHLATFSHSVVCNRRI